jgi:LemA protein
MDKPKISDKIASEVFELAAKLYAEQQSSYSYDQLIQAGQEAQIPPEIMQAALQQVNARHLELKQKQIQNQRRVQNIRLGLFAALSITLIWIIWLYNSLAVASQSVSEAWAQVENQLQRRADLIPNLVAITRAGAQHEQELVKLLTQARQNYLTASSQAEQIKAAEQLNRAINHFQVYAVQYPQLRSNELFVGLQDELAGTENRIAVERMRYNRSVSIFNKRISSFPTTLISPLMGFQPKPYFQASSTRKQQQTP